MPAAKSSDNASPAPAAAPADAQVASQDNSEDDADSQPPPAPPAPPIPRNNRWEQPTLEQLLATISEDKISYVEALIEKIGELEGVTRTIIWYGTSWKWTVQYDLHDEAGDKLGVLAYIIPVPETPLMCIPLTEAIIEKLPLRRLNKYIREEIHVAKRAVHTYWATWKPTANTEVEYLMDLMRRKHKMLRSGGVELETDET